MSISAQKDANRIPALLATSSVDGVTVVAVVSNPVTHRLKTSDGATGSSFASVNAQRDNNRVSAIWGISNADGVTPIPIYCDATGALLTKST